MVKKDGKGASRRKSPKRMDLPKVVLVVRCGRARCRALRVLLRSMPAPLGGKV